jgi:hypothetical protein
MGENLTSVRFAQLQRGARMATVKQIIVNLKTSDRAGAGTNGHVYLGLGGREFNLNLSTEDREPGATDSYTLGEGANILNKNENDPRAGFGCPLEQGQLIWFPVYIRFQGENFEDSWNLDSAGVRVFSSDPQDPAGPELRFSRLLGPNFHLWLGGKYGNYRYLNPSGPSA